MQSNKPILGRLLSTNEYKQRQPIIQDIQKRLDAKLIVYTASPFHPFAQIIRHDIPPFEDLLISVANSEKGYLMMNSPGGDADTAEKLLIMCRKRFTKEFNFIVPDYAKSAATMIALGSDKILMGYLAELGPIDPQLRTAPPPMPAETIPARSFIDGLEMIRKNIKENGDPPAMYLSMMAQIRPEIIARCQSAIDSSKEFAKKWLKKYMLKNKPEQAEQVAEWLSSGEKYKSHGKVIDFNEVKNVLELNVEMVDKNSELWSNIWELYVRSINFLQLRQRQGAAKLFESESVSLTQNLQLLMRAPAPRPTPRPAPPPAQRPTPRPTISPSQPRKKPRPTPPSRVAP